MAAYTVHIEFIPHSQITMFKAATWSKSVEQGELVEQGEKSTDGAEIAAPETVVDQGPAQAEARQRQHPAPEPTAEQVLHWVEAGPDAVAA